MKTSSTTYRSAIWLGEQKAYRVTLLLGAAFLALLILAVSPFLLARDVSAFGKFPEGSKIAGVNVSGLTRETAKSKVIEALRPQESEPFVFKIDNENYVVPAAGIDLHFDYDRMVDRAYNSAWDVTIAERLIRRFLRTPRSVNTPIMLAYDRDKLAQYVYGVMGSVNCKPRDAFLDISTGAAVIMPARDGRQADAKQVFASAEKALDEGLHLAQVPLNKRTPAKSRKVDAGKLILVNLGDHTLSLYDRDTLIAKFPVATGSTKWPTCIGQWKVVKAEKNPTWYNRGSTWAENMPWMLPPGPNNPLGTRAITINGGGVLIHGTNDTGSIGYSASHGCVRMYIKDVEALFEHVTIGMPVYIIKASGAPGFDCSKKPFWWDEGQ